ncbi:hypothetical protein B0A50_04842 [Salinomyces thailandicus]|uniref:Uncharacterized protein n=1 Tax=Salinomyces thailandicus TaxID=706561 RepID=A0A4U0TYV4_9PEZI|nr:hypothetical protein B0A50_04842 [Salinomyces thailandica]
MPSHPPYYPHPALTQTLTPTQARTHLAAFLAQTPSKPYLHPDAQLSTSGIAFSAQAGPSGGLALHHLGRIEKGLGGECLVAETDEELGMFGGAVELPEGDDARVDGVIEGKGLGRRERGVEAVGRWAEQSAVEGEWEDGEAFALQQRDMAGEIGDRGADGEVRVAPPVVEKAGEEDVGRKPVTEAEKKAKREAKKARRKTENQERRQVKEEKP